MRINGKVCRIATRCGQPLGNGRPEKGSGLKAVRDPTATLRSDRRQSVWGGAGFGGLACVACQKRLTTTRVPPDTPWRRDVDHVPKPSNLMQQQRNCSRLLSSYRFGRHSLNQRVARQGGPARR